MGVGEGEEEKEEKAAVCVENDTNDVLCSRVPETQK